MASDQTISYLSPEHWQLGHTENDTDIITNKYHHSVWLLLFSILTSTGYAEPTSIVSTEPIMALPQTISLNQAKVALGEKLFSDKRLSDSAISCASCHQLSQGGDSGHISDTSHGHSAYAINTPGIFNARYNFRQNWDGSDYSLKIQLEKIFSKHAPFNTSLTTVINRLKQDKALTAQFNQVYKKGLTKANFIDSLVEFEKSLVTPNSKFDQYLNGNKHALNKDEIEGYHLFKQLGCISCHQGINIGGNLFQKFGIFYDYIAKRGNITNADFGRINITGRDIDKYSFKVPSLRNIAVTAPYLHDGSARTLEQAIFINGKTELGRNLDANQIRLLTVFLRTLTGEYKNIKLSDKKQ